MRFLPLSQNDCLPFEKVASMLERHRFQKQYEANELAVQEYFENDKISSMQELVQKLDSSEIPKIIVKHVAENFSIKFGAVASSFMD